MVHQTAFFHIKKIYVLCKRSKNSGKDGLTGLALKSITLYSEVGFPHFLCSYIFKDLLKHFLHESLKSQDSAQ